MKILPIIFILIFSLAVFGQNYSPDWQKIPATFQGDNFEKIYNTLLSTPILKEKGEFETTADYEKRINNLAAIKFAPNLTAESQLVFVYRKKSPYSTPKGIFSTYDADKQELEVNISTHEITVYKRNGKSILDIEKLIFNAIAGNEYKFEDKGEYKGSNAYGVTKTVSKSQFTYYSLAVKNISEFATLNSYLPFDSIKYQIPATPDKAKSLKENLSVLYVTRLLPPYFDIEGNTITPTFNSPQEIKQMDFVLIVELSEMIVFDGKTGEIFLKVTPGIPQKKDSKKPDIL